MVFLFGHGCIRASTNRDGLVDISNRIVKATVFVVGFGGPATPTNLIIEDPFGNSIYILLFKF